MNILILNIILLIFIFSKSECKDNKNEDNLLFDNFPEFRNIPSQELNVVNPSKYCKCHQKTVFFKYQSLIGEDNMNEDVTNIKIKDKEYFVTYCIRTVSKYLIDILKSNNLIRIGRDNRTDVNLYWRNLAKTSIAQKFENKYQRYNHMLDHSELSNKERLYQNYRIFRDKYPNDFNYIPETYTKDDVDLVLSNFKNYTVSENNLWLIKPKNLLQGKGIRFLKSINDYKKGNLVTKYISNPLLINNKKFDLRVYLLETGHDPLKIYIYKEFFARMATEDYDVDIKNLDNTFKHLTNIHVQQKNEKRKNDFVLSYQETKDYIEKEYNIDFSKIWDDIKDIAVKSFITLNHIETNKEQNYTLHSNNLFHLSGFDIMIDRNKKSWLIEVNDHPAISDKEVEVLNYKLLNDILNIAGIVPYSHKTGLAYEEECKYKDTLDEVIQQSICEFTRPLGGFERIFPKKENIDYYKKFFKKVTPNNQVLWDEIKKFDLNIEENNKFIKREL
ncbi:TTL-domain-containing protein [Neocallimastix sp. 'constans']|jgi:hypothetical protein